MIIFITTYPANTLLDPVDIAPESALSPTRAIAIPLTKTVPDPPVIDAEWGRHSIRCPGSPFAFVKVSIKSLVCAAKGCSWRCAGLVLQKTLFAAPANFAEVEQGDECPVVEES